jgi:myosin V
LKRRRDECIQLKTVLAQQSQSIKMLGQQAMPKKDGERYQDDVELQEAFSAQKLVNRQLESELTALTQENNAKLEELSTQLDNVRREKMILQEILQEKLNKDDDDNWETLKQNENYLRYELELATVSYVELQSQMNELTRKMNDLTKQNTILVNRLRENGLNYEAEVQPEHTNIAIVKKKTQNVQGILKYRYEDEEKIMQRLINDLKPRVAITLSPGLPAIIIFMCIRYTDMVNMDNYVRTLLSNFVINVKKLFKLPNSTEVRILWLVNTLTYAMNFTKDVFGNYSLSIVISGYIISLNNMELKNIQNSIRKFKSSTS